MGYLTSNKKFNGMSKRLTESKYHIKQCHLFDYPFYILNDVLQDNKTQPKQLPRPRVGVYLGRSREHASNVSYVLNLKTGHISPQYHIIYDDDFTTVTATRDADKIKLWEGLKKAQPDHADLKNELDVRNNFTMEESPQLTVLDVSAQDMPSGESNQI